jgi:hypothetical protein
MNARMQQAVSARNAALFGADVYRPSRQPVETEVGARLCGAPGCNGGWTRPWKNRTRPIFEEEWGCGGRCLQNIVRAAVRRETGDATALEMEAPHRHRVPLGLVLLAQGWITHPQLQTALEAQRNSGHGRIGDWLAQSCGLDEERITRGLGMQWSCPILAREGFAPAAMALVMPRRFVTEFGLLPLRVAGSSLLYMAFENRMDAAAALAVEQMSGLKVESGLLGATEFAEVRAGLLAAKSVPVETSLQRDADALTTSIVKILENRQPIASRMVRVHGLYWLRLWLESGAIGRSGTLPESTEDVEDYLFLIDSRRTPRPPVA